ncbi:MAG: hypothetical protein HS110_07280 [Zoogloeaceae bacterium]|nr:hypothetical protein [Zoogloeaceae bacterium]MCK6385687.1 hypothetical protein [Rhodocyclaceae bacterium]
MMPSDTIPASFEALATIGLTAEKFLRERGNETSVSLHMRRILRAAYDGLAVVEAALAEQRKAA